MAVRNATSAAKARKLERQAKALELRRAGLGYVEIAAKIGVGKSQAHRLVQEGLRNAREQIDSEAADLKAEDLSRLDGLLATLWPAARSGALGAVDRVIKILERRAKLLGLDAPVKLAHGGDGAAPPIREEHVHRLSDADLERLAASGRP